MTYRKNQSTETDSEITMEVTKTLKELLLCNIKGLKRQHNQKTNKTTAMPP